MFDMYRLKNILEKHFDKINNDLSEYYNQPVGRLDKKIIIIKKEFKFIKSLFKNEITTENISNNIIINISEFIRIVNNYIIENPYKTRPLGQIYDSYFIKIDDILFEQDEIVLVYSILFYIDNRYINKVITDLNIEEYEFYNLNKRGSISYK